MLIAASNTLPDNAGYVVAAYLVFLALILIYLMIMAAKLGRIGREVAELDELSRPAETTGRERDGRTEPGATVVGERRTPEGTPT